jgi:SpoVK/Ycf46/Vps4 family AAA+-type ATPase
MTINYHHDEGWLEMAEVVTSEADLTHRKNVQTVCLSLHDAPLDHPLSHSVVLQVFPRVSSDNKFTQKTVFLHPILFLFLQQAASMKSKTLDVDSPNDHGFCLAPLPMLQFQSLISRLVQQDGISGSFAGWKCHAVEFRDLNDCSMHLSCIYTESQSSECMGAQQIATAMQGRIVKEGCIMLLSSVHYGFVIVKVTKIESSSIDVLKPQERPDVAYRISGRGIYHFHMDPPTRISADPDLIPTQQMQLDMGVPGYEALQTEILEILQVHPPNYEAAVSGILVVGCSGVGKTRMTQNVAYQFQQSNASQSNKLKANSVYYLSVQDLFFQASTEMNLLKNVLAVKLRDCTVWILDDLALLEIEDNASEDGEPRDSEYIMVRNAILEAIDKFHRQCLIVGIAQNESNLPREMVKIGRLEKTVQMFPPSQSQRIQIWKHILGTNEETDAAHDGWATALARLTPGFVARDIIRTFQEAKASRLLRETSSDDLEWEDLMASVKKITPSQLEELDVIKSESFSPRLTDKQVHFQSFKKFGGYSSVKKHLYLHVVSPWKRFLRSRDDKEMSQGHMSWLEPPPGVLFHGKSGTGKTSAAICLATSLQLPLIQVRAADVLDKWLGGSEALLRSLFAKARTASPCILFLDEIDSLAGNRDKDDNDDFSSRILSTLLNEMDGVSTSVKTNQVLVMACTNRIESLDAALLRPGRLQEHIFLELPAIDDLTEILELGLGEIPLESDVSMGDLASILLKKGATGADIEGLCREACIMAMRNANTAAEVILTRSDIENAIRDRFIGSATDL